MVVTGNSVGIHRSIWPKSVVGLMKKKQCWAAVVALFVAYGSKTYFSTCTPVEITLRSNGLLEEKTTSVRWWLKFPLTVDQTLCFLAPGWNMRARNLLPILLLLGQMPLPEVPNDFVPCLHILHMWPVENSKLIDWVNQLWRPIGFRILFKDLSFHQSNFPRPFTSRLLR